MSTFGSTCFINEENVHSRKCSDFSNVFVMVKSKPDLVYKCVKSRTGIFEIDNTYTLTLIAAKIEAENAKYNRKFKRGDVVRDSADADLIVLVCNLRDNNTFSGVVLAEDKQHSFGEYYDDWNTKRFCKLVNPLVQTWSENKLLGVGKMGDCW